MKFKCLVILPLNAAVAALPGDARGQTPAGHGENSLEALPRDLEVRWSLSAIPPYLRSDATVYILDPAKGYVLAKQGGNGFNCFVERTDYVREEYRKDLIYPVCFDPEGSKPLCPCRLTSLEFARRER